MIRKKFLAVLLVSVMALPVWNTAEVNAAQNVSEDESLQNVEMLKNDISGSVIPNVGQGSAEDFIENITITDNQNDGISSMSETDHNTADTALFLSSDYMGTVLTDKADAYDNWYYFYADANKKISSQLEQPSNGNYDLYLYEYVDGSISLVSYSINGGTTTDSLSYISKGGYYFLRTVPVTADDSLLYFIINILDTYDSNEPDDNANFCREYHTYINVKNTIDNVFDQDWMKLTVETAGTYKVELNNVPSNCQYAVYIYDSSLSYLNGMLSDGNANGYVSLEEGVYYLYVRSHNNAFDATQPYSLKLSPVHSTSSVYKYTNGGKIVEITPSTMYINGSQVDFNWTFRYDINYTRHQQATITNSTKVMASSYKNGSFVDAQNINSSTDCIKVKINNFNYFYFYYFEGVEDTFTRKYDENNYQYFYIDANTGKAIGTDVDIYLTWPGFKYTFNEY
ncbi:MAG: hypothetical protein HFI70_05355 [Lachnospiraceae bacterium]|nr:hypothetical protein [Lachnospiraceae bacterium]